MNPSPYGVSWQAEKNDMVVCLNSEGDSRLQIGRHYRAIGHNRESGFITIDTPYGGEMTYCHTRFQPVILPTAEPKKNDKDKPRMDIVLSIHGIEHVGHVFGHGAKKYDEFNWRKGGNDESFKRRMAAAAVRHLTSYLQGTKMDDESKEPHLAHAIADLLMILDLEETK